MIASVDESVGRIMALLDELKLAENTVLIFTSDNGGVGGYEREGIQKTNNITDNAPLRSGKGSLYEGGTRVPFIIRWPGRAKPGSASDVPAIQVDIYPTLVSLAGGKMPAQQVFDGESLAPLFRDSNAQLAREAIYQHFPGYLGAGADSWRTTPVSLIHAGEWKLMEYLEDGRLELYNLRTDLGETKNLAASEPERAKALHAKLAAWRQSVNAPMPTPNTGAAAEPEKKRKGTKKAKV
jgi:arylsulfatase A-like enzyme